MHLFTKNQKLAHIIRSNYHLLPVINRFGIKLGFGDKTIEEICTDKNLNKDFVLHILNAFHNKDYFPESDLLTFSPVLIIDYLKKAHVHFTDYSLPKIESLLNNLTESCKDDCDDLKMINTFYRKYKKELLAHINEEEKDVFPYILKVVELHDNLPNDIPQDILHISVMNFEKEHSDVEEKLNDLKNLIIKYLNPVYNSNDCNEFLFALFRFEKDIIDHARIEDKILIPQIVALENAIKNAK